MPRVPIDDIPTETLITVFREVTREPIVLMQLAMVCRNWRDIVLGTSELWNHITIHRDTSMAQLNSQPSTAEIQLRRQLELSGDALLELNLEWNAPLALWQLVLEWNSPRPTKERTRSLEINIPYSEAGVDDRSVWRSLSEGHTWPRLKKLWLMSPQHRSFRVHLRASRLETIKLQNADFIDWSYVGLGSALYDVERGSSLEEMEYVAFFRALARCPNLRRLHFATGQLDLTPVAIPTKTPVWSKLSDLGLGCRGAEVADILIFLFHTPNLTTLDLDCGLVQSVRRVTPPSRLKSSLRELTINLSVNSDDTNAHGLGLALLQGLFDHYDLSKLGADARFTSGHRRGIRIPAAPATVRACSMKFSLIDDH